ncbi:uncharacterized protein [Blastocystis hominis]|uniref:LIM zinc-binding domain-containing protein n=1 Tax=Blastocystis hominis TaxID=12968 RepID=D8M0G6_BLAHO|nr:uncharacterized protein [Blastocystis hominis]CBK21555.2 unnamed protein product [Blastocystis hominis]|eukprot:XP_012895603.1 uncharacterized protein [Blastocystis hominis]
MKDNKPFCCDCCDPKDMKICFVCNKPIMEDTFIEAMGNFYHQNHFVCFICKKPFSDVHYYRKDIIYEGEKQSRPLCSECTSYLHTVSCPVCACF